MKESLAQFRDPDAEIDWGSEAVNNIVVRKFLETTLEEASSKYFHKQDVSREELFPFPIPLRWESPLDVKFPIMIDNLLDFVDSFPYMLIPNFDVLFSP